MRIALSNRNWHGLNRVFQIDVTFTHYDPSYGLGLKYIAEANCQISEVIEGGKEIVPLSNSNARFSRKEGFTRHRGHQITVANALVEAGFDRMTRKAFWQEYWGGRFNKSMLAKLQRKHMLNQKHNTPHNYIHKQLMGMRKAV